MATFLDWVVEMHYEGSATNGATPSSVLDIQGIGLRHWQTPILLDKKGNTYNQFY